MCVFLYLADHVGPSISIFNGQIAIFELESRRNIDRGSFNDLILLLIFLNVAQINDRVSRNSVA